MERVTWTRRYRFRSVHRLVAGLHREQLHGHHFTVELTFDMPPSAERDREIEAFFETRLDGQELSNVIGTVPTGENLTNWIHDRFPEALGVALQETRKNRFVSAPTPLRLI